MFLRNIGGGEDGMEVGETAGQADRWAVRRGLFIEVHVLSSDVS